jgi:hypothetical protein
LYQKSKERMAMSMASSAMHGEVHNDGGNGGRLY